MQTWTAARRRSVLGVGAAVLVTWACGTGSTSSSGADAGTGANGDGGSSVVDSGTVDSGTAAVVCTGATQLEIIVCQANAFLATLSDTERAEVNLDFSNATAKTYWSNLPGLTRAGVKMGNLSASSQAAALALMSTALTEAGMSNVTGIRAADDYLNSVQSTGSGGDGGAGGGGMGGPPDGGGMGGGGAPDGGGGPTGGGGGTAGGYGSGNYSIAIFGTPSTTGNWELTFGGHHMAYNLNFIGGVGYPVPNHLGVEPKFAFTFDGGTYQPLEDEGDAFFNVFTSMSSTELTDTHISGTFSDVVMGPVEYGTGSYANVTAAYPTGASNRGVFASTLNATSKAAVIGAIKAWVQQFHASYSDDLVAAYTSDEALAQTYVAWGGNESLTSGPDRDEDKTYLRIDGPRIWLELACQQGVVIPAYTHFHTIYRDKQFDYGGEL